MALRGLKILLDSCIWGGAFPQLEALGYDVEYAGQWAVDPGDEEILKRAESDSRILITLDKDFGELAIVRGAPHKGIIRLSGFSATEQAWISHQILLRYALELMAGALVVADPQKIRIRPPE
ncbi:MAG: DUF5615 family PIN-like protein [Candidatus Sumerlaeaceae bacterium]